MPAVGVVGSDAVRYMSVPAGFHPPIRTDRHGHRPRNVSDLPRSEGGSSLDQLHAASQISFSRPGTMLTAATNEPCDIMIGRVTSTGIRRVHDRCMTGSTRAGG